MQLSLFLWCRLRKGQSHAPPSKAIVCASRSAPPRWLLHNPQQPPKSWAVSWDVCEIPNLIAGLKELGRIPGENITLSAAPLVGEMKAFSQPQSNWPASRLM